MMGSIADMVSNLCVFYSESLSSNLGVVGEAAVPEMTND